MLYYPPPRPSSSAELSETTIRTLLEEARVVRELASEVARQKTELDAWMEAQRPRICPEVADQPRAPAYPA